MPKVTFEELCAMIGDNKKFGILSDFTLEQVESFPYGRITELTQAREAGEEGQPILTQKNAAKLMRISSKRLSKEYRNDLPHCVKGGAILYLASACAAMKEAIHAESR